jgi:hypothetical protein
MKKYSGILFAALLVFVFSVSAVWGYYFDDRREMSLSGFAYTRGTWALSNDDIGTYKGLWQRGNLVQHRNFVTLEWRHNVNRAAKELPTPFGPVFQFLNFDAFDYYLNVRFEYDGVWEWGGNKAARLRQGGKNHNAKYFGQVKEKYPGQFARYVEFEYASSRRRIKEALWQLRLFEWYVNITKGPLFIRLGRQNLSWGESDGFRLLDQINPLDNNFGGFLTALDERRIPLDMLRAQWSFGTVGPIQDLTLEGFVSVDQETAARTTLQGSFWTVATNATPIAINRTPCGDPFYRSKDFPVKGKGIKCSLRAEGPHASIEDARGGGRILGTIRDFTFSLAHYYTWGDVNYVRASIISPTPAHLLWDLNGLGNPALLPATNPWGPNDPAVGLTGPGTPGAFLAGTPAAIERNVRSVVNNKRIQVTGASLSFPVNALTGMFVGSDNPLYYVYTTFRSEIAYFRDVGVSRGFHDLNPPDALARFLTPTVLRSGVPIGGLVSSLGFRREFAPGGRFAGEAGGRAGAMKTRDFYAWLIGLDHNQWIRWLNPTNSFTISGQLFWFRGLGVNKRYKQGVPPGLSNDIDGLPVRPRNAAPTGPNPKPSEKARVGGVGSRTAPCILPPGQTTTPCGFKAILGFPVETQIFTLAISTPYYSGNLTPRVTFFYDFSGSWLVQPGIDWTFWDPFRLQIRYNYLDGRYAGIGFFKTRDNIWVELQYLLY